MSLCHVALEVTTKVNENFSFVFTLIATAFIDKHFLAPEGHIYGDTRPKPTVDHDELQNGSSQFLNEPTDS